MDKQAIYKKIKVKSKPFGFGAITTTKKEVIPTKADIELKKASNGTTRLSKQERLLDLSQKLFNTKGKDVLKKIIDIALQDGNPNQMQALKLCLDRIAPVSFFERQVSNQGRSIKVEVNIADSKEVSVVESNIKEPITIEGEVISNHE